MKIVAFALKVKDVSFWDNAVLELEISVPDNIPGISKGVYGVGLIIFKGLENLITVRDKVKTMLKILISRPLLIEYGEYLENFKVRMHDVIRDVGIWIATEGMVLSNKEKHIFMISHGKKGWPTMEEDSHSNYTCISLLFSHHNISFPEFIDCPKLEFLRLELVKSISAFGFSMEWVDLKFWKPYTLNCSLHQLVN